eukprot:gene33276-44544_t
MLISIIAAPRSSLSFAASPISYGAHCVVSDVNIGAEAESVAGELRGRGAKVATIACDVSDPAQCQALVHRAVTAFGSVDIFVNNAGIGFMMKPLLEVVPEDWAKVIAVNLSGAFYGTQAAAKAMVAAGKGGRIINIASQAAKTGFPHLPAYVSSKHGMVGLTRASAVELGAHRITVNAVCPNHVTTGLGAEQNAYFSKLLGFDSIDAYLQNMAAKNPMGRPGLASDTAAACAWLASDQRLGRGGNALREERIDWPNGAKLALSIVVNVEEGSEMTIASSGRFTSAPSVMIMSRRRSSPRAAARRLSCPIWSMSRPTSAPPCPDLHHRRHHPGDGGTLGRGGAGGGEDLGDEAVQLVHRDDVGGEVGHLSCP